MPQHVEVTRIYERGPCFFVEGVVISDRGEALKAAFTVHKPDVHHMSRDEFQGFCVRQLPSVTEDIRWEAQA